MRQVAVLDLVSTERQIVDWLIGEHWGVVSGVADCDPSTAEQTLEKFDHSSRPGLDQLVLRYALTRRAAGLPVVRPSAA